MPVNDVHSLMSSSMDIYPIDENSMDQHPPPPLEGLLKHEFVLNITSPKGSGKTTLIYNLIMKYRNFFHKIFVVSPTVSNDEKWKTLFEQTDVLCPNEDLEKFLDEHQPALLKLRESVWDQKSDKDNDKDRLVLDFVRNHYKPQAAFNPAEAERKKSKVIVSGKGRKLPRGYLTEAGAFMNDHAGSAVMMFPQKARESEFTAFKPDEEEPDDKFMDDTSYFSTKFAPKHLLKQNGGMQKDASEEKKEVTKGYRKDLSCKKWQSPKFEINMNCVMADGDPQKLQKLLDVQDAIIQLVTQFGKKKQFADRILMIFDDMVGSDLLSRKKSSQCFKILNVRHRHFSASMIFVSQAYTEIIRTARVNMSALIVFDIGSDKELEVMYKENQCGLNQKQWLGVYRQIVGEPHQFMTINYQTGPEQRIFRGLAEPIATAHLKDENVGLDLKDHPPQKEEDCHA